MKRQRSFACAIAMASLLGAARVSAVESEPVRFEYVAAKGCPVEAEFVRAVESRSPRLRIAREGEPARTFRVTLGVAGGAATGDLVVLESGQGQDGVGGAPRSVRGRTCAEAMQAIAFVAALSVDPKSDERHTPDAARATSPSGPTPAAPPLTTTPAGTASPATATPSATASPPTRPPSDTASAEPALPAAVPAVTPPVTSPVEPASQEKRPPAPATSTGERPPLVGDSRGASLRPGHSDWAVGAGVDAMGLAVPGAVAAFYLFGAWRWERSSVLSPEVRLCAARTLTSTVDSANTHTSFSWTFGRLELSPVRLGTRFSVEVAPFLDVGVLSAVGGGTAQTFSPHRPWVTAGGLARAAFRPLRWLAIEGQAGGFAPLLRDTFLYGPAPVAYTPPKAAAFGGIGGSLHFP